MLQWGARSAIAEDAKRKPGQALDGKHATYAAFPQNLKRYPDWINAAARMYLP